MFSNLTSFIRLMIELMSSRSNLEDGRCWFSTEQGGDMLKGRDVLNLPPGCSPGSVSDHCFIAREVPGEQSSGGSLDARGTCSHLFLMVVQTLYTNMAETPAHQEFSSSLHQLEDKYKFFCPVSCNCGSIISMSS